MMRVILVLDDVLQYLKTIYVKCFNMHVVMSSLRHKRTTSGTRHTSFIVINTLFFLKHVITDQVF